MKTKQNNLSAYFPTFVINNLSHTPDFYFSRTYLTTLTSMLDENMKTSDFSKEQ